MFRRRSEFPAAFLDRCEENRSLGRARSTELLDNLGAVLIERLGGEPVDRVLPTGFGLVAITRSRLVQVAVNGVSTSIERVDVAAVTSQRTNDAFVVEVHGSDGLLARIEPVWSFFDARRLIDAIEPAAEVREQRQMERLRSRADSGDIEAVLEYARRLSAAAEFEAAENVLLPFDREGILATTVLLAELLEARGAVDEAVGAWRRAEDAGEPRAAETLGRMLREMGDLVAAKDAFRRCLDRGELHVLADYCELVQDRAVAGPDDVSDAAARVCAAEDWFSIVQGAPDDGALRTIFAGLHQRCDSDALVAGTRRADEDDSASGAYYLGELLLERGDAAAAAEAFARAAERGRPEGWTKAVRSYLDAGDIASAEAVARLGERSGDAASSTAVGTILKARSEDAAAREAFRRADAGNDTLGAFELGTMLLEDGELDAAEAAFRRAIDRGAEGAEAALDRLLQQRLNSETKRCPDCAEEIKTAARVCRYCGFRFDGRVATEGPGTQNASPHTRRVSYRLTLLDRRSREIFAAPFQSPDMAIRHADENPAIHMRHTVGSALLKGALTSNIVPWKTAIITEIDQDTGAASEYHRMERSVSMLSELL